MMTLRGRGVAAFRSISTTGLESPSAVFFLLFFRTALGSGGLAAGLGAGCDFMPTLFAGWALAAFSKLKELYPLVLMDFFSAPMSPPSHV